MIRLRPSGADEVLIKRVRDWYEPGPGVFIAPQALFNPALLFTTGINGVWHDPSDLNTLFQNAAGTTPVTAVEQPVGLMLDKSKGLVLGPNVCTTTFPITASTNGTLVAGMGSVVAGTWYKFSYTVTASTLGNGGVLYLEPVGGPFAYQVIPSAVGTYTVYVYAADAELSQAGILLGGGSGITGSVTLSGCAIQAISGNHAFNSSGNSANFPVLSARYNLLTKTEQFDDAAWIKTRCSINANAITAPDGTLTADKLIEDSSVSTTHAIQSSAQTLPLGNYTGVFYGKAAERTWAVLGIGASTTGIAYFDLANGAVGTVTSGYTASIQSAGNGWFKCTLTGPAAATLTNPYAIYTATGNNGGSYTGNGTSGIYIWGADLRVSNDALNQPSYQRVNTATDYDTAGFKPYLKFNGTNQWLQTNSVDFSYGDKMFVCAGVRKLSDASLGMLFESSTDASANGGALHLYNNTDQKLYFRAGGSIEPALSATVSNSPYTFVFSGTGNISAGSLSIRLNSSPLANITTNLGTGNYGNYPLYIGARAGSGFWFNGRLHQLVVAGKQASDSEIGQTEAFVNQKTGAY